jgi:hypothetical protein
MKAPREEEEGGIIAQGAHDVNGIVSKQAANVLPASIPVVALAKKRYRITSCGRE